LELAIQHSPSTVVTLGVGWDVQAERKLKEQLPNGSLFYGADPIYEENDKLFSSVGVFFPIAVGNETKLSQAHVMPKELKGKYEFRTTVHIDIITFLTKLTKTPFVDQLLMDNEVAVDSYLCKNAFANKCLSQLNSRRYAASDNRARVSEGNIFGSAPYDDYLRCFTDLIRGPEYDIIPMMGVGAEFDQNNIAVCQINAEVCSPHFSFSSIASNE
ncbi:hypothetical protein OESDEN_01697, partial [Oesophagostomum dentatum]